MAGRRRFGRVRKLPSGRYAFRDGARAGDPAYVRLWDMGAGTAFQLQADYVAEHRPQLEDALTGCAGPCLQSPDR